MLSLVSKITYSALFLDYLHSLHFFASFCTFVPQQKSAWFHGFRVVAKAI